jgi:predicted SAM-dependent methyltransferase
MSSPMWMAMTKKLNIGAGKCYLPREQGWTNVDIFSSVNADVYADMAALPFDRESFDLLLASHVLEHSHRATVYAVLSHWRSLLVPGGILRIAVPNFQAVVERYLETQNLPELMGLLYGGQNHPKNVHTVTFDQNTLTDALKKVGFEVVRPWDWRKTEHAAYDDYSRAVLPHLDFQNGKLMSLNLEAVK